MILFDIDRWLMRRARQGDPEAFGRIYDRHSRQVFHLLRRLTGDDRSQAEDLTQETFVAAYQALPDWRGEGKLSTWLCGIAYRRYASSRRRQIPQEPWDDTLPIAAPNADPLLLCTGHQMETALEEAIAALPERAREAFVLVRVEGMRYRDAADLLQIPLGTLQSRLGRATLLLRDRLAAYLPDTAGQPSAVRPAEGETNHAVR